jgi:hypothetical protein
MTAKESMSVKLSGRGGREKEINARTRTTKLSIKLENTLQTLPWVAESGRTGAVCERIFGELFQNKWSRASFYGIELLNIV